MTRSLAAIGLGANLGDASATLTTALAELAQLPDSALEATSPFYRSAPIDADGPDYLNAVALLRTGLPPLALLAELQRVEARHGRERGYRNAPRTLDLDLLVYDELRLATPALTLPHPRMHERAFVLRPLADVAPELSIPGRGAVSEWLPRVVDQRVEKIEP
ncbi:MAG: 2-amino-4-hydroxy-6-hydroxymethyldihydropteridine diphosphokinase [Betaproteobacteria bacterium]|jgi:2-amino-4-hydroxy-6-hydroxymethyldihydropteridine diphosphokinase|nr:MAG: 2-amino-4-hydroxy-6-hydroxymethyldihydropteridine diphosphokinase [Betaproteobacteria bacterium]